MQQNLREECNNGTDDPGSDQQHDFGDLELHPEKSEIDRIGVLQGQHEKDKYREQDSY